MLVIVIGRGQGGTRLISSTLEQSGVYMGPVNDSGDMVPPDAMYDAVKLASSLVQRRGKYSWDFTQLLSTEPSPKFRLLVEQYIQPLRASSKERLGWKLPETTLVFPWISKMFPDAYYIYWTRDPRDAIAKYHLTDHLWKWGVPSERHPAEYRLESYLYQRQLVDATTKPEKFLEVRFEDFVLHQEATLATLTPFLGLPLVAVPVVKDHVGFYKHLGGRSPNIPKEVLERYGYTR